MRGSACRRRAWRRTERGWPGRVPAPPSAAPAWPPSAPPASTSWSTRRPRAAAACCEKCEFCAGGQSGKDVAVGTVDQLGRPRVSLPPINENRPKPPPRCAPQTPPLCSTQLYAACDLLWHDPEATEGASSDASQAEEKAPAASINEREDDDDKHKSKPKPKPSKKKRSSSKKKSRGGAKKKPAEQPPKKEQPPPMEQPPQLGTDGTDGADGADGTQQQSASRCPDIKARRRAASVLLACPFAPAPPLKFPCTSPCHRRRRWRRTTRRGASGATLPWCGARSWRRTRSASATCAALRQARAVLLTGSPDGQVAGCLLLWAACTASHPAHSLASSSPPHITRSTRTAPMERTWRGAPPWTRAPPPWTCGWRRSATGGREAPSAPARGTLRRRERGGACRGVGGMPPAGLPGCPPGCRLPLRLLLQVVWKGSKRVGCGLACGIVTCSYDPPGEWLLGCSCVLLLLAAVAPPPTPLHKLH